MNRLTAFSIPDIASALDGSFSIANIAYVDDLLLSVCIRDGALEWHKHLDADELFWVHDGTMILESERGATRLADGDLTVVPKGTRHRSRSADGATVVLLRCGLVPDRKNGKRRLYATEETNLPRINLQKTADTLDAPFRYRTLVSVEDARLQLARGSGRWPIELPVVHDRLLYVVDGFLKVRTVRDEVHLMPGDLTVVPRGAFYRLHTEDNTVLMRVTREVL